MKSVSTILYLFLFYIIFINSSCDHLKKLDETCPKVINLSGNLSFGQVQIGTTSAPTLNLRITNSGTCPLNIFTIVVPVGFSHNHTANSIIAPNQFLDIAIDFSPNQIGSYNGIISINSDATDGVSTIVVSGTGIETGVNGIPILSVTGDIEFGTVPINSTISKTLILYNIGDATLAVVTIQSSNPAFTISGVPLTSFNIEKNESKQLNVTMNTSVAGSYTGQISIYTNANNKVVNVSGEVMNAGGSGMLSVIGDAEFGTIQINSSPNKVLNLSNTGDASLKIDSIQSGSDKFTISGVSIPFTLAENASQAINIQMNTSTLGTYNGDITIYTDANTEVINASGVVIDSGSGSACPATFIDSRDEESYGAKMLAGKCWMTENLRYDSPNSGADIPYNGEGSLLQTYGRYYPWAVLMDGAPKSYTDPSGVQGVCPNGWHVPSRAEIQTLVTYYGDDYFLANNSLIEGGSSDLNFQLGGKWEDNFGWNSIDVTGNYWTTSGYVTGQSCAVWFGNYLEFVGQGSAIDRLSCRCVKD